VIIIKGKYNEAKVFTKEQGAFEGNRQTAVRSKIRMPLQSINAEMFYVADNLS
jgi:hypothetical protein